MRGIEGIWLREEVEGNKEDSDVERDMIYRYYVCVLYSYNYWVSK